MTPRAFQLRAGIAVLPLVLALPGGSAFAQGENEADAATEAAEGEGGIGEILVTAQRREETVQRSSLSISVIDEETVDTITDARALSSLVPGVQISSGGSTLQTYVRGVGDFGSSALNQSSVSYNVDGVYVADTASVSTEFYDLERVEILKGPQGTLYGRNASAGSVNLIPARPELGNQSIEFITEIGNYEAYRVATALNVPLGDVVALRASGTVVERDGYLSDGTGDDRYMAGRLQLLLEPSETFSLRVAGDVSDRWGNGPGAVLLPHQAGNGKFTGAVDAENNAARLAVSPIIFTPGAGLPPIAPTGLLEDSFIDAKQHNIQAELNLDVGIGTVTFIPAHRNSESSIGSYNSGAPFLNQEDIEQQSYELRFAHEADWGSVILGGYYLDLDQFTAAQVYTAVFVIANQFADLVTESIAGFGQANINVTDDLRLIAGVRYTEEDRSIDAADVTNGVVFASDTTFKKWTWRGGIEYDLAPASMAYVTVSKGFKSGGFNIFAPTPAVTNAYQPETLYSYAAGIRNRFFDDTLQFNIEAFYWDYKDAQQNALQFTPAGNLQFSTFNAASATLYGVDADLVFQPTPNDVFSATVAFLDTKFDRFVLNTPFPTDPAGNTCLLNNAAPPFSIDCSGFPLPRAPRWSGNAGYQHTFDLADGSGLRLGADMDFASKRWLGIDYVSNERAEAFVRFNAEATYTFADDRFSVAAFVRNITNKEIPVSGIQAAFTPNLIYAQVAPPRTYGLRLKAGF